MAGRPPKITDKKIAEMKNYMIAGLSLKDACLLLDVSVSTWRLYENDHPDIRRKRKQWQGMLKAQAKINIAKQIMGSNDVSLSVYLLDKEESRETKRVQNALTRAKAKKTVIEAKIAEAQLKEIETLSGVKNNVFVVDDIEEAKQDD